MKKKLIKYPEPDNRTKRDKITGIAKINKIMIFLLREKKYFDNPSLKIEYPLTYDMVCFIFTNLLCN